MAASPKKCPSCGVEIPTPDLTACTACGASLTPAGAACAAAPPSPGAARLARIASHPDLASYLEWSPPENETYRRASRRIRLWGLALCLLAVLALLKRLPLGAAEASPILYWTSGAAAVLLATGGLVAIAHAMLLRRQQLREPLLKRPALVTDRSSQTTMGFFSGHTVYYFSLELEDGSTAVVSSPGRGADNPPLTKGTSGLSYTRGDELLAFRKVQF